MRILLLEDEARLAETIARGLREEGFIVELSADGEDALHRLRGEPFDLAILDIMLPKRNGWAVLELLRAERPPLRVLVLTARQTFEDRVRGLESGADDYLVKPFAFAELLARVRAVLRRPIAAEPLRVSFADLDLDHRARTVKRGSGRWRFRPRNSPCWPSCSGILARSSAAPGWRKRSGTKTSIRSATSLMSPFRTCARKWIGALPCR